MPECRRLKFLPMGDFCEEILASHPWLRQPYTIGIEPGMPTSAKLGRETALNVVIPSSQGKVSRQHVEFTVTREGPTVKNISSKNPVFVNEERLYYNEVRSFDPRTDVILFGGLAIWFEKDKLAGDGCWTAQLVPAEDIPALKAQREAELLPTPPPSAEPEPRRFDASRIEVVQIILEFPPGALPEGWEPGVYEFNWDGEKAGDGQPLHDVTKAEKPSKVS